ncbi:CAP domain-containing protein [Streptomyces sp. NPDC101209]|uniref:CAP domain-containing protein n=1 Tax=Streptomyces sp. NPDC101209 TaxID=3366129 RepID=UPI00380BFD85
MGRHRRSAAGRAATGRATTVTGTDGSYASGFDPQQYSYSYDPPESFGHDVPFGRDAAFGHDAAFVHEAPYGHDARESFAEGSTPAMGTAPYLNTEEYAETSARSAAYLFATEDDYRTVFPEHGPDSGKDARRGGSRRRKKRAATPVKTGLLGVSAAVAIGTVAVATGAMPGLDNYKLGGGTGGDKVQAASSPTNSASEQGGASGDADSREEGSSTSRGAGRAASPAPSVSASTSAPTQVPTKKPKATPSKKPKATTPPKKEKTSAPAASAAVTVSTQAAAEAEVLRLVNIERNKVGCSPVAANSALTDLAENFSDAMAAQDFFDHTDPSGATPWDRAAKAGISNLGGENIARGQADAAAVMDAWMNSPGHRANILNCDFKTLGVGVHFGTGGPWWTQDFGY